MRLTGRIASLVSTIILVVFYATVRKALRQSRNVKICQNDFRSGYTYCRPSCNHGNFSLPGMTACRPWLGCDEIQNDVVVQNVTGRMSFSEIKRGLWRDFPVSIVTLNTKDRYILMDFYMEGMDNIRFYQPSSHVVQLIGVCGATYVTELHPLGSPDNLESVLQSAPFKKNNNLKTRLGVCASYVDTLQFLHTSPQGKRVFCNSNTPQEAMRQFWLTSDFHLVFRDMQRIPEVDSEVGLKTRQCGRKTGGFAAPEQASDEGYDERSDIWKIPDVCAVFLGPQHEAQYPQLLHIHARCKEPNPSSRPSARQILEVYRKTLEEI